MLFTRAQLRSLHAYYNSKNHTDFLYAVIKTSSKLNSEDFNLIRLFPEPEGGGSDVETPIDLTCCDVAVGVVAFHLNLMVLGLGFKT